MHWHRTAAKPRSASESWAFTCPSCGGEAWAVSEELPGYTRIEWGCISPDCPAGGSQWIEHRRGHAAAAPEGRSWGAVNMAILIAALVAFWWGFVPWAVETLVRLWK
jgi:hypothetical protein